ncbi:hypothetical protein [Bradyrhizobium elkanii]|uniref:hypothetical protein n=1 Tax=Bradyrhizobium elkanii TaxID=29448 RepID=UPI0035123785
MTSTSVAVYCLPHLTKKESSDLSAPELFEAGRAFDDLAGFVAFFVEVVFAEWTIEVGLDVPKDVFREAVTEVTHVRANRLLMSTKRRSCRRCRPRSDFENGSWWRFQVLASSRKRNAAPMARWSGLPLQHG